MPQGRNGHQHKHGFSDPQEVWTQQHLLLLLVTILTVLDGVLISWLVENVQQH